VLLFEIVQNTFVIEETDSGRKVLCSNALAWKHSSSKCLTFRWFLRSF